MYPTEILAAMPGQFDIHLRRAVQKALEDGKGKELEDALTTLLMQTVSYFDLESEKEYQTWLLGLLVCMPGYKFLSNREAGEGRYDICVKPRTSRYPGMLIELKHEKSNEASEEEMKELAIEAVRQIRKKKYAEELRAEDVHTILEFGSAFRGKTACVVTGDEVPAEE